MERQPICDLVEMNSAKELFDFISLSNPIWGGGMESSWLFRGQFDARWPLRPSAWRGEPDQFFQRIKAEMTEWQEFLHEPDPVTRLEAEAMIQVATEIEVTRLFHNAADKIGLSDYLKTRFRVSFQ